MRHSVSVLLPSGEQLHWVQKPGESKAEFDGKILCLIEEAITGKRGPTPAGTLWCEWCYYGHSMFSFWTHGMGRMYRSTGNPYEHRVEMMPGIFGITEARAYIAQHKERT